MLMFDETKKVLWINQVGQEMQIMGWGDGSVGTHVSWESPIVRVQSKNPQWREPNPGGCFLTSSCVL